ncbi:MAG: hypothetical protein ABDH28_00205 [Brevinematia bacterium]
MKRAKRSFIILLVGACVFLSNCVAVMIPSISQYYHKDNAFISASIGYYPENYSGEFSIWINKENELDTGVSLLMYVDSNYDNNYGYSAYPFVRKWFKSGDKPVANFGVALPITFSFDSRSAFTVGPEGFGCVGLFGETLSLALVGRVGLGFAQAYGSGVYWFLSASAQINFMPIKNFGIGAEISPSAGADLLPFLGIKEIAGVGVVSPFVRAFVNLSF